jgi:hypothetical protein
MTVSRVIEAFIASPGDLAVERRASKDVIDELNAGFGRGAHVTFEPLGWEDALAPSRTPVTDGHQPGRGCVRRVRAGDVATLGAGGARCRALHLLH